MSESNTVRAAYETQQFFELDLPDGMTPEDYMETKDFRDACADLVTCGFIEFKVEREFDAKGSEI